MRLKKLKQKMDFKEEGLKDITEMVKIVNVNTTITFYTRGISVSNFFFSIL